MNAPDPNIVGRANSVDIGGLVSTLLARRIWIGGSTLLFSVVFALSAFLMTPIYRTSTVLVDASTGHSNLASMSTALAQGGALASLADLNVGGSDSLAEEALAVLRSREFTDAFIRDLDLMPSLFSHRWDEKAGTWKGAEEKRPTLAQASTHFQRNIRTITRDRLTGLITLTIEWKNPTQTADWANTLVARLNEEMRSRALARTTESVGFLETELRTTATIETRQAINRLIEAQINQRMLANTTEEYVFRVVDKAFPSDPRDMVRPKKPVLLVLGPLLGLLVGSVTALIASSSVSTRRRLVEQIAGRYQQLTGGQTTSS